MTTIHKFFTFRKSGKNTPKSLNLNPIYLKEINYFISIGDTKSSLKTLEKAVENTEPKYTNFVASLMGNWAAEHKKYLLNTIDLKYFSMIDANTRLSIIEFINPYSIEQPNTYTDKRKFVFAAKNNPLRFIFRRIPFLDFSQNYFKPLLNENYVFSKNNLLSNFNNYKEPLNAILPNINDLAIQVNPSPSKRIKKMLKSSLFNYLMKGVLKVDKNYYILIYGDSGSGKTTFLQKLFYDFARTYPTSDLAFIYSGDNTIPYISTISEPENTILFIDALDEDTQCRQNLQRGIELLAGQIKKFKKVIITCRPQLFANFEQEWHRIESDIRLQIIDLPPLTDKQAVDYLKVKFRDVGEKTSAAIILYESNKDFFKKPIILSWFDILLENNSVVYTALFQVYDAIVQKISDRESNVVEKDNLHIGTYAQNLVQFSKKLAVHTYDNNSKTLNIDEIHYFSNSANIINIDAQSRSFLSRDRNREGFHFTHASFIDYFLSIALFDFDIKEEGFPFESFPEVERFFLEMCWIKNAKLKHLPLCADGGLLNLNDDRSLIESYHYCLSVRNRAFRSMIVPYENILINHPYKYLAIDLITFLKPFLIDRELKHYIFDEHNIFQNMLDDKENFIASSTFYVEQFLNEYIFSELTKFVQFDKKIFYSNLCIEEYQKILPKCYPKIDFGEVLDYLFQKNFNVKMVFKKLEKLTIRGIGLKNISFLTFENDGFYDLVHLDLSLNSINAQNYQLRALFNLTNLNALFLFGNPLLDINPDKLGDNSSFDCLEVLRSELFSLPDMVILNSNTFLIGRAYSLFETSSTLPIDEEPNCKIRLHDFMIGKYPVTLGEFRQFIEAGGYITDAEINDRGSLMFDTDTEVWVWQSNLRWNSNVHGDEQTNNLHPVINISWYDAIEYCNWLSQNHNLRPAYIINKSRKDPLNKSKTDIKKWTVYRSKNSNGYRLPTEAEWEYACQLEKENFFFAGSDNIGDVGWYIGNSNGTTQPVGIKKPIISKHGQIFDLCGNIYEWCENWYKAKWYNELCIVEESVNPTGPDTGSERVRRGGSWRGESRGARVSARNSSAPNYSHYHVGFRLVRSNTP